MKYEILFILSFVALALGQRGNADAYVDEVLKNARDNREIRDRLDPLRVDDIRFKRGSLSNIQINGILSLARSGPATLTDLGNGNFAIDAELGLNKVTGSGRWAYKVLFIPFRGGIWLRVGSISCRLQIALRDGKATLRHFSVDSMRGVFVLPSFLGPVIDWVLGAIASLVVAALNGPIKYSIGRAAGGAIATALEKVDVANFFPRL